MGVCGERWDPKVENVEAGHKMNAKTPVQSEVGKSRGEFFGSRKRGGDKTRGTAKGTSGEKKR